MSRSVLLVAPLPTHPPDAGNRRRLLSLAESLKRIDWQPVLLCTDFLPGDLTATRDWWGEHFYLQHHRPASFKWNLKRWLRPLRQHISLFRRLKLSGRNSAATAPEPLDAYYEPALDQQIASLNERYQFGAVIAMYVFMSRALLNLQSPTRRLIDTNEVFALGNATKTAPAEKIWCRISSDDELAGLRRADVVIAIQDHDAATFRSSGVSRVVTFGHPAEIDDHLLHRASTPPDGKVLFVAAGHPFDVDALTWFAEEVYPKLAHILPADRVIIAGGIRDILGNRLPFTFLGRVSDLDPIYTSARVVIAPIRQGTGLKIKVIEALGRGKALVSTSFGARGLESAGGWAFALADSPESFAATLERLLLDDAECLRLMAGAQEFARAWNQKQVESLRCALED